MKVEEYAKFVEHCNFTKDKRDAQLLAALGLSGESGEVGELIQTHVDQERLIIEGAVRTGRVAELVKKNLIHGKPLDLTRLKDELGDVLWYFFHALNTYGLTFEEVAVGNVVKLCERHENNGDPEDWIENPAKGSANEATVVLNNILIAIRDAGGTVHYDIVDQEGDAVGRLTERDRIARPAL